MDSDILNKLFLVASRNQPFEEAGVDEKFRPQFNQIVKEIKSVPEGLMISPVNEWVGDEYDEIIDVLERGIERVDKRFQNRPENTE